MRSGAASIARQVTAARLTASTQAIAERLGDAVDSTIVVETKAAHWVRSQVHEWCGDQASPIMSDADTRLTDVDVLKKFQEQGFVSAIVVPCEPILLGVLSLVVDRLMAKSQEVSDALTVALEAVRSDIPAPVRSGPCMYHIVVASRRHKLPDPDTLVPVTVNLAPKIEALFAPVVRALQAQHFAVNVQRRDVEQLIARRRQLEHQREALLAAHNLSLSGNPGRALSELATQLEQRRGALEADLARVERSVAVRALRRVNAKIHQRRQSS